jgi:hypothetical protein
MLVHDIMEDDLVQCMHCQTINLDSEKYCGVCDFRLPHNEEKHKLNSQISNKVLLFLVVFAVLFLTAMFFANLLG